MQTFLPHASFWRTARELDDKRLGKQRVEALQVLYALKGLSPGWGNHPITRMWRGYEYGLAMYGIVCCRVWRDERGFRDTTEEKLRYAQVYTERLDRWNETTEGKLSRMYPAAMHDLRANELKRLDLLPWWFGWKPLHASHRSNLMRKNPQYYAQEFGELTPGDLPYLWPDATKPGQYTILESR